ncbi:hypothetical protein NMG60_11021090 [Bertholletia excelsa]
MLCSVFEGEFLGFLCRSVRAMGCFFGCFRIKDDQAHSRPHLVSESVPSKPKGVVLSRNPLSSLLAEEKDDATSTDKKNFALGTPKDDNEERQLKDEARFLKACGTLPATPAEFRKASEKFKVHGDSEPLKFHSWLPNASIEKLDLEKLSDQPPTPIKLCEEKELDSLEHTPSSCISNWENAGKVCNSSIIGSEGDSITDGAKSTASSVTAALASNMQGRNKSVRFEFHDDAISISSSSSSEIAVQNSKQPEPSTNYSVSKPSPYPTPLKITDEMQTPGTVFPAYLDSMANRKNPRVRSQYVYSVHNPVENLSQWKLLKEEESGTNELSGHLRESLDDNQNPELEAGKEDASVEKDLKVEASLSAWLKPPPNNQDRNHKNFGAVSAGKAHIHRTPGDRPIIGMVAAHWNEEPSHISPKFWDGNGIPNSTNKYKEDQKVSWHATPFEERLEKALSDETCVGQRMNVSQTSPIDFSETEESDTALSQLQPSTHSKPVVSF